MSLQEGPKSAWLPFTMSRGLTIVEVDPDTDRWTSGGGCDFRGLMLEAADHAERPLMLIDLAATTFIGSSFIGVLVRPGNASATAKAAWHCATSARTQEYVPARDWPRHAVGLLFLTRRRHPRAADGNHEVSLPGWQLRGGGRHYAEEHARDVRLESLATQKRGDTATRNFMKYSYKSWSGALTEHCTRKLSSWKTTWKA